MAVIGYLAPEIPALSATFVYEELLGLERRGHVVIPISMHRPATPAAGQAALAARTRYLYRGSRLALVAAGLAGLPAFGRGAANALRWLLADMFALGPTRLASWKLAFQFLAAVRLAGLLRRHGCVHLHVHFAHAPAQIAMYAAALADIPFTIQSHANDIFERALLMPRKALRAKKLLSISRFNCQHLRRLGVDADMLAVVRCGVSFAAPQAAARRAPGGRFRIGTLGRLVEKKGMDVLVAAVAELAGAGVDVELDIAGDGPLRRDLEAQVRRLGLAARVRFLGSLDHAAVAGWMRTQDVFALACKADANGDMDGIPVVLMEAMSQGVPVVSTRISGVPELVLHEATGLLAAAGDSRDLAVQFRRLHDAPELAGQLARRAAAFVQGEFSQDVNLDRLLKHLAIEPEVFAPGQKYGNLPLT